MADSKPPVNLTVEGQGLKDLQRKLKALEDGKILRRELNRELRLAAKPLIGDARAAARSDLPKAGGFADRVASAPMRISVTSSQRSPGVKIVIKGIDAKSANSGRIRHMTWGHTDRWVTQKIKPGWFTDAMRTHGPRVRPSIARALQRAAEQISNA